VDANPLRGATYLVEHYRPDLTIDAFRGTTHRVREAVAGMTEISFLHSTLIPEDETAFCVFRAESAALVEEAYRRAGVGFERIVEALELEHS
jgi:hypothetical protein